MRTSQGNVLDTFMQSAKTKMLKTQPLLPKPIGALLTSTTTSDLSFLSTEVRSRAFQIEWDNDIREQIGEHLVRLRRFRDMTQKEVADAMGTSQSAVARIETGQENFTADTLRRHVLALKGHFIVSIGPDDVDIPRMLAWWKWTETIALAGHMDASRLQPFAFINSAADATHVFMGLMQTLTAGATKRLNETEAS